MKNLVRVAVAAAVLGFVYPAAAQSEAPSAGEVKKAAKEFSAGRQAYRNGEYLEAAERFEDR